MHGDLLAAVATARIAEMHEAADRRRQAAESRAGAVRSMRRRMGWWFVTLGLRLAVGRIDAPALGAPIGAR